MNRKEIHDALFGEDLFTDMHKTVKSEPFSHESAVKKPNSCEADVAESVKYAKSPLGRPRSGFDYVIATDGACSGNPGPGGWAWIDQVGGAYQSSGEENTTNNRMELIALIRALEYVPAEASLLIRADSSYVINSLTKWAVGWRKRGWRKADGKPVLNRELIERLLDLYEARSGRTEVEWVKGHAGDAANEFVDRLAVSHTK